MPKKTLYFNSLNSWRRERDSNSLKRIIALLSIIYTLFIMFYLMKHRIAKFMIFLFILFFIISHYGTAVIAVRLITTTTSAQIFYGNYGQRRQYKY